MKNMLQKANVSTRYFGGILIVAVLLFTTGDVRPQEDGDGLHLRSPYAEDDPGDTYKSAAESSVNEGDDISTCGAGYLDRCDSSGACECIEIEDACSLADADYHDREADVACDEGYAPQWHQLCGWRCVEDKTCPADTIFKCDIYGCGCKEVDDPAQHWCCPEGYDIVGSTCEKVVTYPDGVSTGVQTVKRKVCKEVCEEMSTCPANDAECVPACIDYELECEYVEVEVPLPYKVERVAAHVCATGTTEE